MVNPHGIEAGRGPPSQSADPFLEARDRVLGVDKRLEDESGE
jgi:hypothetical protein